MSPPIRDGSGSSIGSIRLGDGSEISEVRTGAGDVLFSALALDSVVDDFEDQSMSEYSANSNTDGSITQAAALRGNFGFEISGGNPRTSTSGLDNYPSIGNKFSFLLFFPDDGDENGMKFHFGVQSSVSDSYQLEVLPRNGDFVLRSFVGGSKTALFSKTFSYTKGVEYRVDVDWQSDHTISAELVRTDTDSVKISGSGTDTDPNAQYTGGGISLHPSSGGVNYIDQILTD